MDKKIGKIFNVEAQVVNGICPTCTQEGVFVSVYKTIFKILAKILYLVIINGCSFNAEVVELVDTLS